AVAFAFDDEGLGVVQDAVADGRGQGVVACPLHTPSETHVPKTRMTGRQNAAKHLQGRFEFGQRLRRPAEGLQAKGHVVQARRHARSDRPVHHIIKSVDLQHFQIGADTD
ncbi:MAG: hypothetical protein V2A79_08705, partial [Planctomycetota bacterium]